MKFSIIFPTRGRTTYLNRALESIKACTKKKHNVEVLIGIDDDDQEMKDFSFKGVNLKKHIFKENCGDFNGHAYRVNSLAEECTTDAIWLLSDEIVLHTKCWDKIVERKIKDSKMKVWYGETSDFVVRGANTEYSLHPLTGERFSCFPMVSRYAFKALGYITTPKLRGWGSDLYLRMLFSNPYIMKIIDLHDIEVEHTTSVSSNRMSDYKEDLARMVKAGDAEYLPNNVIKFNIHRELLNLRKEINKWNYST